MNYSQNFTGAIDKAAGLASRTGGLVCTEHLLYGMAAQSGCNAQRMLAAAHVDADAVLSLFTLREPVSRVAMSTRANRAVANATALAKQTGAGAVNTEHLLFAVLYDRESVATQMLEKRWGIDTDVMRAKLWQEITGEGEETRARQQKSPDLGDIIDSFIGSFFGTPRAGSGEGGEAPERLATKGTKENRCSAIKQVASGRFGVTSRYLVSADEIQIKMAQGAKPGEGGHLPGKKVYPWIARTRYSTPGVSLISPPPHHDIYSIEDLAQLIYDLKNANRDARISVKLVSEAGVGTIASGVAKAGAQVVLISGYDGGTGAAPGSSIHNAGLPWELGLSETHQTLLKNGLRGRIRIETDGKLMSGRDVAIAAMLGAEEFGFATAPLVALGCVMMRVCNKDTCPMGVATQNPELRKCFRGKPEYVIHFMEFIAQELREYMAKLGVRTVDELVGRSDLLKPREEMENPRGRRIDLQAVLSHPWQNQKNVAGTFDFGLEKTLDVRVLLEKLGGKLEKGEPGEAEVQVKNTDRTFGTIFGSEITRRYPEGLPEDTYRIHCSGTGGQSFGAFIPRGLTISLRGDSNDYFGKGLSGGQLIITPPDGASYPAEENMIIGNVAFYGATGGKAFVNGMAGERFCVRNSGATVVAEGVGDHGCEYMTGGKAVILGATGKNFAAGMSGGVAYVLDEKNALYRNINKELVSMEEVVKRSDQEELKGLIREHVEKTGSAKGRKILEDWEAYLPKFKKIIPYDYQRILHLSLKYEEQGMDREQALVEAFYESTGQKRMGGK